MGDYFTDVVNFDKEERFTIEEIGEFQKWSYKIGRYEPSLVLLSLAWLTVHPDQSGRVAEGSLQGSWAGERVFFFHDGDATLDPGHGLAWEPTEMPDMRRGYKDITMEVLAEMCLDPRHPVPEMLAQAWRDDQDGSTYRKYGVIGLIIKLLAKTRSNRLMYALEMELGDDLFYRLNKANFDFDSMNGGRGVGEFATFQEPTGEQRFTHVVNFDKKERLNICQLAESQTDIYQIGKYQGSLVVAALGWLMAFRNQKGWAEVPESMISEQFGGRWVGDQVMFCHDGAFPADPDDNLLPWNPVEMGQRQADYADITLDVMCEICNTGTNSLDKNLAERCKAELEHPPQDPTESVTGLVARLLAHPNEKRLERELQEVFGEKFYDFLEQIEFVK